MIGALRCVLARADGDHAATCPRCRAAAAQDQAVRALIDAAPPPGLSARARDAAFARAFAEPSVVAPRRWTARLVPAGLVLAAAAVIAIVVATRGGSPSEPSAPTTRAIVAGARTTVGHGVVALSADGVAWQTGPTDVYLLTGRVDVEVDPAPHKPFRVKTNAFVVDVLGTVFAVSADGVDVSRGAVRVSSPTGEVLVDRLTAGQHWSAHTQTAAAAPLTPPATDDEIVMDPDPIGAAKPDVDKLIETGRVKLSGGDIAGGRKVIEQALAAKPGRKYRAKAELLLADSYRDDDPDEAVKRYRAIADRYPERGEEALGAAAGLESRRHRTAAARELYQLYLDRYPDGALADQARKATR